MIKILHIIDSGGFYGAEKVLLHLASEQARLGLTPILASIGLPGEPEKPLELEALRMNVAVKAFRMYPGPNFAGARRILNFAYSENVSLLHTHGYKADILFGLMPRKLRKLPLVATLHGWTWVGGFNRMFIYEWLESLSFRLADKVVLVNRIVQQHPRICRLNRAKICLIENGIPIGDGRRSEDIQKDIADFADQGFSIIAIGRLSPEKGFDLLINAVAELAAEGHNIFLAILGEGPLKQSLIEQGRRSGLDRRIMLPGYVKDAAAHLPLFNLFAMPSLTEGLPMVLLEAMASGIPVLASRVGGVPDVLRNGQDGQLIAPGDRKGLKAAILASMQNPAAAKSRAKLAEIRVRENYSSRVMAEKYEHVYKTLLANKK